MALIVALILFLATYALMLIFQKYRPQIVLASAALFVILGNLGLFEMNLFTAFGAVDYNVLLMIAGTMGTVALFIESKMPNRLAEIVISKVPNVKWTIAVLALFAGIISAFVDNVATVLMVAPVGLAISKKLNISPVPVLIAIAVSSNLQGAATLVGDTTSIMLGGFANMNFLDFFFMNGKPGLFWAVELGALISTVVLLFIFRKNNEKVSSKVETEVTDYFPTFLLIFTVFALVIASFIPSVEGGFLGALYYNRSGIICVAICLIGIIRACVRDKSFTPFKTVAKELDLDTILLLFGLFIVIQGITAAGVIDAVASLFYQIAGNNPFLLYTLLVFVSVILSAFIDNIPYVATMLPVVKGIAQIMGIQNPLIFYFGLLIGATLGGNLTPIGASANITAIGILRKNGYEVKNKDFLKIGIPFTLAAVLSGYLFIWFTWGI